MKYKLDLYKYKPALGKTLGGHTKGRQHLDAFLKQKLWMTPLYKLNDPFEGCFHMSIPKRVTLIKYPALLRELLIKTGHRGIDELNNEEMIKKIPGLRKKIKLDGSHQMNNKFDNFGAFSFAHSYSNIPMWSHYSNDHQGYCVVFEAELDYPFEQMKLTEAQKDKYNKLFLNGDEIIQFKSNDGDFVFAFAKIKYRKTVPIINFEENLKLRNGDDYVKMRFALENAFGVKSRQWSNENEYRLIVNANSEKHADNKSIDMKLYIPFLQVTGIILGEQMIEDDKEIITKACRDQGVRVYQAKHSAQLYAVELDPI
jgi:hypothetical protein